MTEDYPERRLPMGKPTGPKGRARGLSRSPEYAVWSGMLGRCYNPNRPNYAHWGGRGIRVHRRWHTFLAFYEDMGPRPDRHTLERVDNDGHYEPGNVVWAPFKAQANNRRGNHLLTHDGATLTIVAWSERTGIGRECLQSRINHGWSVADALTRPVQPRSKSA